MQYKTFIDWFNNDYIINPTDYIFSISKTLDLKKPGITASIKFFKNNPTSFTNITTGDSIPDAALVYKKDEWAMGKIVGVPTELISITYIDYIITVIEDCCGKSFMELEYGNY